MLARGLAFALSAALWLAPAPVLPVPSRSGPEGPPRPFAAEPRMGPAPARTGRGVVLAQDRALLYGPFPRGGLLRGISDGGLLLDEDRRVRETALGLIRATGASVVRIPVTWSELVAASVPAGFDARDPARPQYRFRRLDASVRSAVSEGFAPLLVVSHAPAFAEAPERWPYAYPGSWAPSPAALEAFAAALGRRYDGTFPDPDEPGRALPAVRLFQAWNEPNLARYLEPQWIARQGRWQAFSPLLYRQLLNAFYAGVKSVQPGAYVVAAGIAPSGERAGVGRMAPVTFLGAMLCLSSNGRRVSEGCADPPHFDVLAIHPLSVGDPNLPASSSLDVSIADSAKVVRLLAEARRLRTALPAVPKPLWVTELNWESAPQSPDGVPPGLQALWVSRALHRLWVAGVGLVEWEFLIDPFRGVRAATPNGATVEYQRPAGLYSAGAGGDAASAQPKPFLRGFSLPFDPLRVDSRRVRIWALLTRAGQPAILEGAVRGGPWRPLARLQADGAGVLNTLVALRGRARLRLSSGPQQSAVADVGGVRGLAVMLRPPPPEQPRSRPGRPPARGSSRARPAR